MTVSTQYRVPKTVVPGRSRVLTGPMNCGKSREVITTLYPYQQQALIIPYPVDAFKPDIDTRDGPYIRTRAFGGAYIDARFFPTNRPEEILNMVEARPGVVAIDEAQFVKGLAKIIHILRTKYHKDVITAGLTHDFRGEIFGDMAQIIADATSVRHLEAICHCGEIATRTQRYNIVGGQKVPAHYNDPIIMPGDQEYAAVCLEHHIVPGKPGFDLSDKLKK